MATEAADAFAIPEAFRETLSEERLRAMLEERHPCIPLDKVVVWLNMTRSNVKKTLLRSYKADVDYTVQLADSTGGRRKEIILLTPMCFKKLCMKSRAESANQVRESFLLIEEMCQKHLVNEIERRKASAARTEKEVPSTTWWTFAQSFFGRTQS